MSIFERSRDISQRDELDTWLDAHASKPTTHSTAPDQAHESLSDAAQAFHRWADDVQRHDPAAQGPGGEVWNRVMSQTRREPSARSLEMSTVAFPIEREVARVNPRSMPSGVSRFASIAATVLMVLTIAGGGYIALLQNRPGGDEPGRFAAMVESPQASPSTAHGVCDVEPMTVDEVVAIVENPQGATVWDSQGTPVPEDERLIESPGWPVPQELLGLTGDAPDEATFDAISIAANRYVTCSQYGTFGQVLRFLYPTQVQKAVFMALPVYRTEAQVRELIEAAIDEPAYAVNPSTFGEWPGDAASITQVSYRITEDRTNIRVATLGRVPGVDWDMTGDIDSLAYIGLDYLDADGNVIGRTAFDGMPIEGGSEGTNGGYSLMFAHSSTTGEWYYVGARMPRG